MDDIKMIEYQNDDDDQEEVVVEATTSTNALKPTPSPSRIIKKKREYSAKIGYPIVNIHRGYKK